MKSKIIHYDHRAVEPKWQKIWQQEKLYEADINKAKNKFYNLWMWPYPSAEGLHAGHAFASTGSDIYGRLMRMQGKNVFQPMGYDSFGIHSENYAIKINQNPNEVVKRTTKHYEAQMRSLGHGYDWSKVTAASDVDYYRWTQWLFLQLYKAGLAYKKKAPVNWCPSCKTVLADEQVMTPAQAGKEPKNARGQIMVKEEGMMICERCGTLVEKKELEQWFFAITKYADRLLAGLEKIDWSERVVKAQRGWIGKKEGINITYDIDGSGEKVAVFTTRPDTNFGATFIVLAPEHELVAKITTPEQKSQVNEYVRKAKNKSEAERISEGRKKTGVFTGSYAVNQLTGKRMPVWVADFVLISFGTGAVVGVPGHDRRDFEFAREFNLPVIRVVVGKDNNVSQITKIEQVQEEEGRMVNSDFLNGLEIHQATQKIMDYIEKKGWGERVSIYHLRDWLVSRQRYWGAPIPMVDCPKCGWVMIPEKDLPVLLPIISDYKPEGTGKGPLANHPDFYQTTCPKCGGKATRETDVMDTFVDSSWYFLRYPSVGDNKEAFSPGITKNWLPVDLYFGGAEHSVLHLMYARFITKVLYDLKFINFDEPFPKFFAHGLMIKDGAKMSKSRGNVVNPDEYITKYGADTLRLYEMFLGPMDASPDFRDAGIEGMRKFVNRLWRAFNQRLSDQKTSKILITKLHQTIKKVTEDVKEFRYNTAIAAFMEFLNLWEDEKTLNQKDAQDFVKLLAPFAPHLAEEIWRSILGNQSSIHTATWPKFDPKLVVEEKVTLIVQVNGKVRAQLVVGKEKSQFQADTEKLARDNQKVSQYLKGKQVSKTFFVPGKLINFVA